MSSSICFIIYFFNIEPTIDDDLLDKMDSGELRLRSTDIFFCLSVRLCGVAAIVSLKSRDSCLVWFGLRTVGWAGRAGVWQTETLCRRDWVNMGPCRIRSSATKIRKNNKKRKKLLRPCPRKSRPPSRLLGAFDKKVGFFTVVF